MAKVEKFIIKTLLANGFSQEQLDVMSKEEISEIYKRGVQRMVDSFNVHPKEEVIHKAINPFAGLKNPEEIYDISIDLLARFKNEDVVLMVHRHFRNIPIDVVQKITKLLFFAFQEKILDEIASKFSFLPKDEICSIMEIYERQRNDIQHLLQINRSLQKEEHLRQFQRILAIKNYIDRHTNISESED